MLRLHAKRTGAKDPLADKPRVLNGNELYWNAFLQLSKRRMQTAAGAQRIQYSETVAYFDLHGIHDTAVREAFDIQITALDDEFMAKE